jgi:hypothetical protein
MTWRVADLDLIGPGTANPPDRDRWRQSLWTDMDAQQLGIGDPAEFTSRQAEVAVSEWLGGLPPGVEAAMGKHAVRRLADLLVAFRAWQPEGGA